MWQPLTPLFLYQPPPFSGLSPFIAKFLPPAPKWFSYWKALPPWTGGFQLRYEVVGRSANTQRPEIINLQTFAFQFEIMKK